MFVDEAPRRILLVPPSEDTSDRDQRERETERRLDAELRRRLLSQDAQHRAQLGLTFPEVVARVYGERDLGS